ncbi:hypothetical protein P4H70_23095 [Paenibacillus ehimensis]|uniref:hypothetical protein n=1 Tax=Paenibacillus ehimensis TaxID=79264 RepID=UPI002DBB2409|nr:hypothetical protein [Paenibacillus ehimensis]MEC0211832.1 hypothetical protein [Paenibacillus ehimensis]
MYYEKGRIRAAGKATADQMEKVIETEAFERIVLDCTKSASEVMFSIDVPFSENPANIVYLSPGLTFDGALKGKNLYYKCESGTNKFNYVLM